MSRAAVQRRHVPLEKDIETSGGRLRTKSLTGKRKSRSGEEPNGDGYIDAQLSRKILRTAQELADEDAAERQPSTKPVTSAFDFGSRFAQEEDLEDEADAYNDNEDDWVPEEGEQEGEEVALDDLDPEDWAIFKNALPEGHELADSAAPFAKLSTRERGARSEYNDTEAADEEGAGQSTNLADLILQRIAEKEAKDARKAAFLAGGEGSEHQQDFRGGGAPEDAVELPAKVVDTFTKVGQLLSRYKSGPLPKPFKVLPRLPQWPELLDITRPEQWTPNAVYRATKIFISAPASTGQYFLNTVLLDRVQEDIKETKKLNVHLYNSLIAAKYRPSALFKGFLFPLVESGCTLREADIISSVLKKSTIPSLHSAAALLRLCEISAEQTSNINSEAAGSANIFIRTLLEKKYALPYKVVDALVFHFLRFRATKSTDTSTTIEQEILAAKETKLPVLWHQSLLVFAQTYRNEITEDQREALLDLLLVRGHKDISAEVRRELLAGRNRGVEMEGGTTKMEVDGRGNVVASKRSEGQEIDDGDDTMDIN